MQKAVGIMGWVESFKLEATMRWLAALHAMESVGLPLFRLTSHSIHTLGVSRCRTVCRVRGIDEPGKVSIGVVGSQPIRSHPARGPRNCQQYRYVLSSQHYLPR